MIVPDELVLATRIELGVAGPSELSDLVDRRIEASTRVEGVLLELATPLDLAQDDVSSRLEALSGESAERAAAMRVLVVIGLVDANAVTLERAVDYLSVRVAPRLPKPLAAECGALDDELWAVKSGTFGTMETLRERLNEVAGACAALVARAG